jgi:hypothetical protein
MTLFLLIWDTLYVLAFGGFLVGTACMLFLLIIKLHAEWWRGDDTDV